VPAWRAMVELPSCVGAPLLEIHTRFHKAVTYGDRIEVHTRRRPFAGGGVRQLKGGIADQSSAGG